MTLVQGRRYKAQITVTGWRRLMANAARVADELITDGFVDVEVWPKPDADDNVYMARGTWGQETVDGEPPEGVSDVEDITEGG